MSNCPLPWQAGEGRGCWFLDSRLRGNGGEGPRLENWGLRWRTWLGVRGAFPLSRPFPHPGGKEGRGRGSRVRGNDGERGRALVGGRRGSTGSPRTSLGAGAWGRGSRLRGNDGGLGGERWLVGGVVRRAHHEPILRQAIWGRGSRLRGNDGLLPTVPSMGSGAGSWIPAFA